MKFLIPYTLFAFGLLIACQSVQQETSEITISAEESSAAKALIQGVFDHIWGGLDSTKMDAYHTDDFIILEQGQVWDNNRIKQYIRDALERENRPKRINKMEYISVEKHGSCIQLAYYNNADFMQGDSLAGQAKWLESATVIPTENGWRIDQMHSTWIPIEKD